MQIRSLLCLAGSCITLVAAQSRGTINPPSAQSYEYIVVGSGAGGGSLAARLAQAGKRTLLIEAGDDQGENPIQQIPMLHARSTEEQSMSWDFFVKHYPDAARQSMDTKMTWETPEGKRYVGSKEAPPQASKAEMKGILYPRSGTLGGCTAHNALVSVYPHDADWQLIQNLTGDNAWDPATMRKVYTRMEASRLANSAGTNGHGHGWLNVNIANTSGSFVDIPEVIRKASQSMLSRRTPQLGIISAVSNMASVILGTAATVAGSTGMFSTVSAVRGLITMMNSDLNNAYASRDNTEGLFMIPLATKDGKRAGSRDAIMRTYLATLKDGKRQYPLDIALETLVTKVITDGASQPKATGVEVLLGSHLYRNSPLSKSRIARVARTFTAEKEVILSAGAFNTPQLLKLSGIGPKDELSQFKIPVIVDLPGVGTNLQDHMEIGVTHELGDIPNFGCTFGKNHSDPCISMWKRGLSLYSASTNGLPLAVLKKSSVAIKDKDFATQPDLFLFGGPTNFRGYYPGYADASYQTDKWTWVILKAHTNNRAGTVKLRSRDPLDAPEINFNFFEAGDPTAAQHDIQAMVEGIDLGRNLSTARSKLVEKLPGPAWDNSQAVREYVKYEAWSHHASCTCPIGANDDKMAVLDSKLRVRGVKGLRVADASVFPRIPGFFVAIPTYMVGEKAADFILAGD